MKYLRSIIRIPAFFILTFGIYSIWYLGNFFARNKPSWRQFIFRHWAKGFLAIAGVKVIVSGNIPKPPFFMVSNHLSYIDIPLVRSVLENIFVTKGEIEGWSLAGTMIGNFGNIYINRGNKRDIPRAGIEILETLNRGEGVVVFPEGTTTDGSSVEVFKSSFFEFASAAKLPVSYVSIRYETPQGFPSASESVCWWRLESTLVGHMWKMFQLPGFTAFITFGENPIQADNRKDLAKKLHAAVSESFTPMK
jgi:1-acyl-sn-glycerol-3-phosphate acyltransferase